jgi:hypothetical protein
LYIEQKYTILEQTLVCAALRGDGSILALPLVRGAHLRQSVRENSNDSNAVELRPTTPTANFLAFILAIRIE